MSLKTKTFEQILQISVLVDMKLTKGDIFQEKRQNQHLPGRISLGI